MDRPQDRPGGSSRPSAHERPIKECYWVVPGRLLAGEYPRTLDEDTTREKLDRLLRAGVTVFVDLTEEDEGLEPYAHMLGAAVHHRLPIRDASVPDSMEKTAEILDTIDRELDAGHLVYVHCWGGVGRTGLVVGCWLARHGLEGQAALARLRQLWRECPKSARLRSPETPQQERCVVDWRLGR